MDRLSILLACLLFFGLLENTNAQSQSSSGVKQYTQISGEIRNVSDRFVGLTFFSDMISFTEELYQVPLDSLNRFSMRFELNEATQVTFDYAGQNLSLYLEPGDDLQLRLNGSDVLRTLVIKGKGAIQNQYLHQTNRMHGQWDEENILYEMEQRGPMDFRNYMDGLRRQKWSFLNQFPAKKSFSEDFLYFTAADIDYWWAYYLFRYRLEHYVAQGNEKEDIPEKYYSFLDDLVISNDRATFNPYYLFFLDQYLLYKEELNRREEAVLATKPTVNILVSVPNLFIMTKPEQQPIVTEVKKGDRMRYLDEKSDFKSKIMIKEALHEAYWYKVKTGDGHVGWAIGVGLLFEKEMNVDTTLKVTPENRRYQTALRELKGKALYYTLANDLYFRAQNLSLEALEKEVQDFDMLNPIKSYDQTLRHTLATAQQRQNPEHKSGATNYRIITSPEIMTTARVERDVVVNEKPVLRKLDLAVLENARSLGVSEDVILLLNEMYQHKLKVASTVPKPIIDAPATVASVEVNKPKEVIVEKEVTVAAIATKPEETPRRTFAKPAEYIELPPSTTARQTSPVFIKGKLENNTLRGVKLVLYSDPITFLEEEIPLTLNRDNSFSIDVDLSEPQIGYFAYGGEKTPIYIAPGDHLNIRFNAVHFFKTLHFSGTGNTPNNYLLAKRKMFADEDEELRKQMKDLNPESFAKYMKEQRALRIEFLKNYEKSYSFAPGFINKAKAEITFWYANQLMNYPWEHPLSNDQNAPMDLPKGYYEFLQEVEISNPDALAYQEYTFFLDQYFDYLLDQPENNSFTKIDLAERYLYGEVLAFYKTRIYTIACKRGKAKANGPDIRDFMASSDNESYNEVLRNAYNEAKGLTNGAIAPEFTLTDAKGQKVSLNDFKGKVVYLDFWASWCSPCIMQMRNSREWKSRFKGKDVVFVYVSLDKSSYDWRNFVKTLSSASSGIHLIADSGSVYKSKIAKLYHVKRLPNVFILDKNGKVYFNSAKDTAQMRMSDMIENLLLLN